MAARNAKDKYVKDSLQVESFKKYRLVSFDLIFFLCYSTVVIVISQPTGWYKQLWCM